MATGAEGAETGAAAVARFVFAAARRDAVRCSAAALAAATAADWLSLTSFAALLRAVPAELRSSVPVWVSASFEEALSIAPLSVVRFEASAREEELYTEVAVLTRF